MKVIKKTLMCFLFLITYVRFLNNTCLAYEVAKFKQEVVPTVLAYTLYVFKQKNLGFFLAIAQKNILKNMLPDETHDMIYLMTS